MSEPTAILSPASLDPPSQPDSISPRPAPVKSFVGHARLIGSLTLVSRLMGLLREIVAAHYLGAGLVASAFTVAFTIPNLFRKLFGEGALSAAFIPLYAQEVKKAAGGQISAVEPNSFAAASVNLLVLILIVITLIGEAILGGTMYFARDLRPDRVLTLRLLAIMLPYVILICSTAFFGAILQVHRRFGAPAAAPIILNAVHVIVVLAGARLLMLNPRDRDEARVMQLQTTLSYWLGFAVLVAGGLQVAWLLPALRAAGFRFRLVLHFWTPLVRKMLRMSVPVALGAGVLQISVLLDKGISTLLMQGVDSSGQLVTAFHWFGHSIRFPMEMGAPARLDKAQFLYQFPLGIFAIALATAIFPTLSSDAMDADKTRFRQGLRHGIEIAMWEAIPASLGLILISRPAVLLLFRHGQISTHDADLIARSLMIYSGAIWAFSLLQIINRGFYAIHDTFTPMIMSVLNIVLNLVVEIPLVWTRLGESGMAVGTLVSFIVQALMMLWILDRRVGGLGLGTIVKPILKMLLATALMGLACWGVMHLPIYPAVGSRSRFAWAGQVVLLMGSGGVVYLLACSLMGLRAMQHLLPRRQG